MSKPTEKPDWGGNVSALLTPAYSAIKRALGFIDGEIPTPGGLNALLKNISDWISYIDSDVLAITPGGRLTLTSATPVTSADATGSTVYFTPAVHDRLCLYDGAAWGIHKFTELSQTLADASKSPAAAAAGGIYDVFAWDDSGTKRATRGQPWSAGGGSATARGTGVGSTELELFEGRYVNKYAITNGPAARCGLYLGTFQMRAADSLVHDTVLRRLLWNMYNRVERTMRVTDTTASWAANSATNYQQARASAANQIDVIRGLDVDNLHAVSSTVCTASVGGSSTIVYTGIGLNSTTVNSAQVVASQGFDVDAGTSPGQVGSTAFYDGLPGLGLYNVVWLERAGAGNALNFLGASSVGTGLARGVNARMLM